MASDFKLIKDVQGSSRLQLQGDLDLYHVPQARRSLKDADKGGQVTLDLSGLAKLDTVGALLLRELAETNAVKLDGLRPEQQALFDLVAKADITQTQETRKPTSLFGTFFRRIGRNTIMAYGSAIEIITFFGHACVAFPRVLRSRKHLRFPDIMHHIEEAGIDAIPIISLISFLIAVVFAYQSVAQLRPLGGEGYTVNLIALSVLRELGVLLTAIMVAGRSGSAFTAEIGVMKVREEIDALSVIGIDPFEVLVMPRIIALLIALPLLTFIADISGLLGGALISNLLINIPLAQFFERVRVVAHGHDFFVGMIKAPVFAFLIALVGCLHGMKVSGSAESVGQQTTIAVVKGIFLVLVADAFFSILFERLGI